MPTSRSTASRPSTRSCAACTTSPRGSPSRASWASRSPSTPPTSATPSSSTPRAARRPEVEELGEFDLENRSTLIATGNLNGVFYPFNLDGDGRGAVAPLPDRWRGVRHLQHGLGLDRRPGLRGQREPGRRPAGHRRRHHQPAPRGPSTASTPSSSSRASSSRSGTRGTVKIPVYDFDELGNYGPVAEYGSNALSSISVQLGFILGL